MIHPLVSFFVENCFSQVSDNRGGERGWNKHKGLKNSRNNPYLSTTTFFQEDEHSAIFQHCVQQSLTKNERKCIRKNQFHIQFNPKKRQHEISLTCQYHKGFNI